VESKAPFYTLIAIVAAPLAAAIALGLAAVGGPTPMPGPTPPPILAPSPDPTPSPFPSPTPAPLPAPHVGIQAGHWLTRYLPDELSALRTMVGVKVGDWEEARVNMGVAERVADILVREGIDVDVLPATVPEGYKADLFLSLHTDAWKDPEMSGFKVARSDWSRDPARDDSLVQRLIGDYQAATGLPEHRDTITDNMTQYYAFDYKKYRHAVSPSTPAAIIEMGFLSNDGDLRLLTQQPERAALGIARGVLDFLGNHSGDR
jgi:N-acetylmuramoyl-L-alanine amidase